MKEIYKGITITISQDSSYSFTGWNGIIHRSDSLEGIKSMLDSYMVINRPDVFSTLGAIFKPN